MKFAPVSAVFLLVLVVVLGMKWRGAAADLERLEAGIQDTISDSRDCTERTRAVAGKLFDACEALRDKGLSHPSCAAIE